MRTYKGFTEDLKATYGASSSTTYKVSTFEANSSIKPEVQASMLQNISRTA